MIDKTKKHSCIRGNFKHMKNRYLNLLVLLMAFQLAVGQQVAREEVLLESFTGTW